MINDIHSYYRMQILYDTVAVHAISYDLCFVHRFTHSAPHCPQKLGVHLCAARTDSSGFDDSVTRAPSRHKALPIHSYTFFISFDLRFVNRFMNARKHARPHDLCNSMYQHVCRAVF